MTQPTIGSLFTGYGGLDLAVKEVFGATTAWTSDIDQGACKIIAHRFPGVPNLGDITKIDWADVEPVDIITGGSPCQDLSHAGKRQGMRDGTRSNLWAQMRSAIDTIRPSIVVWENVRGALSADATSDLGPCKGCLDDPRDRGPVLRALGRVLGDLAELGYDTQWHSLRAADIGAPHGRFRVFLAAYPVGGGLAGWSRDTLGRSVGGTAAAWSGETARHLLPTPNAYDGERGGAQHPDKRRDGGHTVTLQDVAAHLLPTPRATDGTKGGPNQRGSSGDLMLPSAVARLLPTPTTQPTTGNGHARNLGAEAKLLPTPDASAAQDGEGFATWDVRRQAALAKGYNGNGIGMPLTIAVQPEAGMWAQYAEAIRRWEALTRPAPDPTEPNTKGGRRLSPRLPEWMMGLPDGWICDVPGITRNEALKAAGNGVVPQQAVAALRRMGF